MADTTKPAAKPIGQAVADAEFDSWLGSGRAKTDDLMGEDDALALQAKLAEVSAFERSGTHVLVRREGAPSVERMLKDNIFESSLRLMDTYARYDGFPDGLRGHGDLAKFLARIRDVDDGPGVLREATRHQPMLLSHLCHTVATPDGPMTVLHGEPVNLLLIAARMRPNGNRMYRLSEAIAHKLMLTDVDVPIGHLNLPLPAFAVELPRGLFRMRDMDVRHILFARTGSRLRMLFYDDLSTYRKNAAAPEKGVPYSYFLNVDVGDGSKSLQELVLERSDYEIVDGERVEDLRQDRAAKAEYRRMAGFACACVYYLACDPLGREEEHEPSERERVAAELCAARDSRRKALEGAMPVASRLSVVWCDRHMKVEPELRDAAMRPAGERAPISAPFIVRGHFHTYITGEGSRKDPEKRVMQLKWIAPFWKKKDLPSILR